jgi:hypothetical protein
LIRARWRRRLALSLAAGAFLSFLAAVILDSNLRSGFSPVAVVGVVPAATELYLLVGGVIARRYLGRRTAYALTDRRALVVRPVWRGGRRGAVIRLAEGPAVTQRALGDRHGTVWIGGTIYQRATWFAGDPGWYAAKPYERQDVTFWNIPDADEVSRLAVAAIRQAGRRRPS